jgi:hypothetical protein
MKAEKIGKRLSKKSGRKTNRRETNRDPLASRQWLSESTAGVTNLAQVPSPSGSAGGDPCKGCHFEFDSAHKYLKWIKGGVYNAFDNVKKGVK